MAAIVGLPTTCLACSCAQSSRSESFARADVVFTGKVRDISRDGDLIIANLLVGSVEKGGTAPEQAVQTAQDEGACGVSFETGHRYQIFATRNRDGRLETTLCSGSTALDGTTKPYISTEGPAPTTSPDATRIPTAGEIIEHRAEPNTPLEPEPADHRTRDYGIALATWLVIGSAIGAMARRRGGRSAS